MTILEVNNLSVSFRSHYSQKETKAVDNVSFNLNKNEVLGIVGESGSGKSVTSLSILGLLPYPKAYHSEETSIFFEGKELSLKDEKLLQKVRGKDISFIFQEPMSSLNPLHTIEKQITEAILTHQKVSYSYAKEKTVELLESTGIENAIERLKSFPHEFSGGQRQRIMIAMAIANDPKILIADEPTTALDVTIQEQILSLLIKLKQENKMSMIFISHDLNVIKKISDRVIVMKDGKIVETGKVNDVFNNPKHSYTKSLIEANLLINRDKKTNNTPIMGACDIQVSYPLKTTLFGKVVREIKAVDNVSINLKNNETLGIVGESGSGKTTLGMALSNLIKYKGIVELDGESAKDSKAFRKRLQIVFQDPYNSLNPRMNIFQIVSEGLNVHFPKMNKEDKLNKVVSVLNDVGLSSDIIYKYPHEFSGGQRQRIAIARALILEPKIIILDEPTSALDVTVQKQIINLLKKLQEKMGMSYIIISHDMNVIKSISDRVAVMKNGQIIEINSTSDIFNNPKCEYTRKLISSSLLN